MITKTVYVAIAVSILAGCCSSKKKPAQVRTTTPVENEVKPHQVQMTTPVENVLWNIVEVGTIKVADLKTFKTPQFTLNESTHTISGHTSCNSFSGKYIIDKKTITTSKMMGTEMACMGLMDLELKIYKAFGQPLTFVTEGSKTILVNTEGQSMMILEVAVAKN